MSSNKYPNRNVINRRSPSNEDDYIKAYINVFSKAGNKDNYDISAVKTVNGENGHAMLKQEFNRSKDKKVHRGMNFISDNELRKTMDKK